MSIPTITRIRPTSSPTTSSIMVVITSTNLANPLVVTFNGTSTTINLSSLTLISIMALAHATSIA
jgi:hypothetical protein